MTCGSAFVLDRSNTECSDGVHGLTLFFGMEWKYLDVKPIVSCLVVALMLLLNGRVSASSMIPDQDARLGRTFVRKLDFRRAPEMKDLAEHAARLSEEVYPKVFALLADTPSELPGQIDIVFKPFGSKAHTTGRYAFVVGRKVYLDSEYFSEFPENLDWLLPHELAHVTQRYTVMAGGISPWTRAPRCWVEGIADYARYKLGYTNDWDCPGCSAIFPHYTAGYACTGAFLLYVETICGSNVVCRLNRELRRGSYSDRFFTRVTGKSLEQLWTDFQKTPAFTPVAAEVNRERIGLGFRNGKPPRNLEARYIKYLKEKAGGILTWEAIHFLRQHGKAPKDGELLQYRYFQQQPGGALMIEAFEFVNNLIKQGRLPGFKKGEKGTAYHTLEPFRTVAPVIFPSVHTLSVRKDATNSIYRYTVVRESKDNPWKLQKAWRLGPGGITLEEYPIHQEQFLHERSHRPRACFCD